MAQAEIVVRRRSETGKGPVGRMRKAGRVPAVIYSHGGPAEPLSVERRLIERLLDSGAHVVGVRYEDGEKVEGAGASTKRALIREVQVEPVSQQVLHVDLQEVSEHESVELKVPLVLRGEPVGVKAGGVLERVLHELEIECPADLVVDSITVDVSGLELGSSLHVEDLTLPKGTKAISQGGLVVVSVRRPREVEEEEVAAAGTEVAEQPEVIGEKERQERAEPPEPPPRPGPQTGRAD
jgi:large subunit ribosomal protein L25